MTVKEKNQYYIDLIEKKRLELNKIHVEWIEFCRTNNIINEFSITPKGIIKSVCDKFNVSENQLKSKTRRYNVIYPRYIATYLMWIEFNQNRYNPKTREKKEGFMTLKEISSYLGMKDHATVINATNNMIDMIENNKTNCLLADYWNDYNKSQI